MVGYSVPIDHWVSLSELHEHLYSLEDQPDAIPLSHRITKSDGAFVSRTVNGSDSAKGNIVFLLTAIKGRLSHLWGMHVPGREDREVFLSTYIAIRPWQTMNYQAR